MKKIGLVLVLIVVAAVVFNVSAQTSNASVFLPGINAFRLQSPVINNNCAYPSPGSGPCITPYPTKTPYITPTYAGPYPTVACQDATCK